MPKREQKREPPNEIIAAAAINPKSQEQVGPPEQKSGAANNETVDQTSERISSPIKQEEPPPDLEHGFHSVDQEANEDGTGQSLLSAKPQEKDTDTHMDATRPESSPNLPLPDPNFDQPKRISPHKRIPPPSSSIPISMQDHERKQPETPERKKTKVLIRQTSRGWVEVDQEKEKELEEKEAEDAGVKRDDSPPEETVNGEAQPEEVRYEPKTSTQAQWQAFASAQPTARVATGFQVVICH